MSSVQNNNQPSLPSSFLMRSSRAGSQMDQDRLVDDPTQPRATANNLSGRRPSSRWGENSIWNISGVPSSVSGLGAPASTRDVLSSSRDASLKPLAKDNIEGKTGSGALVDSSVSESDGWFARSASFSSSKVTDRPAHDFKSSDSTYASTREPSTANISQVYTGAPRHASISTYSTRHAPVSLNASNGSMAPFATAFEIPTASMANEAPQVFTKFNSTTKPPVSRAVDSAWGDGIASHSPVDERKSLGNGGLGYHSQASSRNNSLPPSRHSDVPPQYPVRAEIYPDAQATANLLRQNSVTGTSRANVAAANRFDSPIAYMTAQAGQMSITGDKLDMHNQQHSSVPPRLGPSPSAYDTSPISSRAVSRVAYNFTAESEDVEEMTRALYAGDARSGQPLPDAVNFRTPRYDGRTYVSNAAQYSRQPAHYPGSAASQRTFDQPSGHALTNGYQSTPHSHAAALEQKLRSLPVHYQEQPLLQDPRHLAMLRQMQPNVYGQYPFREVMPLYGMPVPHPNFPHGFPVGVAPVMDMAAVPRGPRETHETGQGVRSQLLEDFKQNAKTNKRYDLKDIYDHVVEFSGDQHGSRFIQLKLESANSDEKERTFREIQPNALQLMTDVFGNYVIQKFFEHGDQTQKKILANKMKGHVRTLSLQMYGCRVVQKALDHILNDQQASLIRELKDDIIRCVKDQNGNHVIQKAIERCDAKDIDFIFSAFTNQIHTLSIHTYGCRVIQRCLEHCELPTRQAILRELQDSMPGLIGDGFGNYVVQHVVEHGEAHDKQKVLDLVIKGLEGYSKHKFASNVVEQCLTHASDAWRREVLDIIVQGNRREGEGMLLSFIRDNYGNYVIQKLLDVLNEREYYTFMSLLQPEMAKAKRLGCGKQVMSIEKKMHRFAPYGSLHAPVAYQSHSISAATTPPPLTSDTRSVQTSSVASVNGDATEGAPASRKGSVQSNEPSVYEMGH
ncbi:hypothetical protein AAFC00_005148 [Neodothiora populina]|uniref:PUM-HD domain-containing protein n=1 Tax=Neodothiora populina TaxID=2781224 RepID=A0ABR3PJY4_9PEZI